MNRIEEEDEDGLYRAGVGRGEETSAGRTVSVDERPIASVIHLQDELILLFCLQALSEEILGDGVVVGYYV